MLRIPDAKPLGISCWVPIFRAAALWVLRTMEGEMDGESEGEGEVEDMEEEQEAWEEAGENEDCLGSACPLSAGDTERGVGGSEEVREEREGMLEVEL